MSTLNAAADPCVKRRRVTSTKLRRQMATEPNSKNSRKKQTILATPRLAKCKTKLEAREAVLESRWDDRGFTLDDLKAGRLEAQQSMMKILGAIAEEYVKNHFSRSTLNHNDAEDMTSEICNDIFVDIQRFETLDIIEAFFREALKNRSIGLKRKINSQKRGGGNVISMWDPELNPANKLSQPENDYAEQVRPFTNESIEDDGATETESTATLALSGNAGNGDRRKILCDCLNELSSDERTMISMSSQEHTQSEMAEELGCNVGDVGTKLARAREKLRRTIIGRIGKEGLRDFGVRV